jgi:hypothetical protein
MDGIIALVVLLIIGVPLILAIWLIVRAINAKNRIEELTLRLDELQSEVVRLKNQTTSAAPAKIAPERTAAPAEAVPPIHTGEVEVPSAIITKSEIPPQPISTPHVPPPMPAMAESAGPEFVPATPPQPPVREAFESVPPLIWPSKEPARKINWEQFMGVKGFAWIGGFALFLGIAFFVKYSFDNNLVPPEVRAAIGFLAGIGLLVGGVFLSRKNFAALSQTLCATGVVVLYAVTFACRALYHFLAWPDAWWDALPAFSLMALITTAGFFLAVRLNGQVVAILGMLGGFLTPILIHTNRDNPLGLFGYIAILDAGLIFVALNKRWGFLTTLAALGTAVMQIGWVDKFFEPEKYFEGNKIFIALAVLLGFNALYLAANWLAKRRTQSNWWLASGNLLLAGVALAFALFFFDYAPLAQRPILLFSFIFLIDLIVAALAWLDEKTSAAPPIAGLAVFGLLAIWTAQHLSNELLNPALAFYFIFAVFHSALPAWQQRRSGTVSRMAAQLNHLFPPLALLLVLVPIFKLQELSFLVWPFVLLVDLLAIVLAVMTATLLPVLAVLLLTLAATGELIFKIPADLAGLPTSFVLLGAFSVFFVVACVWLVRKFSPQLAKTGIQLNEDVFAPENLPALLPASSAVLPFLLLIMATLRLPLADPSPVFGLALLLVVLLLGLTRLFLLDWMAMVGLISVFAVECAWHFKHLDVPHPQLSSLASPELLLGWYLVFFAVFAAFPFIFLKKFADKSLPWAAAALAGPAQFLLIFRLVKIAWPNSVMGLVPAAFAIPALLSLVAVLKIIPAENKSRMTQLAWFGGVALFFITLIFPVQFNNEWITIGWALEGAALLWLFHRVPHPGLRLTGVGLLIAAFVRLAVNPAVLEYHPRSVTPIWNWYLYTYGIATVALFLGTRLLAPPRHLVLKSNAQAVLGALGTALAFLLLNIEIADYFSKVGETLTFQFTGNFARDMSYSIGWALFALVLLVFGIMRKVPFARYAAMALLLVTLLKLFLHDLASLGPLYRIGAFIGVAVILMLAAFAYQKFFSATAKAAESKNEYPK